MPKNLRTFMRDAVARFPGSIKMVDVPVDRRFGINTKLQNTHTHKTDLPPPPRSSRRTASTKACCSTT